MSDFHVLKVVVVSWSFSSVRFHDSHKHQASFSDCIWVFLCFVWIYFWPCLWSIRESCRVFGMLGNDTSVVGLLCVFAQNGHYNFASFFMSPLWCYKVSPSMEYSLQDVFALLGYKSNGFSSVTSDNWIGASIEGCIFVFLNCQFMLLVNLYSIYEIYSAAVLFPPRTCAMNWLYWNCWNWKTENIPNKLEISFLFRGACRHSCCV